MATRLILIFALGLVITGCGSSDSSTTTTPDETNTSKDATEKSNAENKKTSIYDVKSPIEVAKALKEAGAIDDYESDVLQDTGEVPGLKSAVIVEAQDTGFSIELYESRGARKKESVTQKNSFEKDEMPYQADCGTILARIPSVSGDMQSTYEAIAEDIQETLRDTYRDC